MTASLIQLFTQIQIQVYWFIAKRLKYKIERSWAIPKVVDELAYVTSDDSLEFRRARNYSCKL